MTVINVGADYFNVEQDSERERKSLLAQQCVGERRGGGANPAERDSHSHQLAFYSSAVWKEARAPGENPGRLKENMQQKILNCLKEFLIRSSLPESSISFNECDLSQPV